MATINLSDMNVEIKADFTLTGRRAVEYQQIRKILGMGEKDLIKRIFKRGVAKELEYLSSGKACF